MKILVETSVPESGRLSLHVDADVQINISSQEAQRRVTQFVHSKISNQMHGGMPTLVLGEKSVWQVPVHLTFPSIGDAGSVGSITVDVESGEMNASPSVVEDIERHAEQIAARFATATTC